MGHPFKHFKTIVKHRHKVIKLCWYAGVFWQGLRHDLSKFSHTEFSAGAKYYVGTHSPITEERKKNGYSKAWLHHKSKNKHHFEYWVFYSSVEKRYVPVKMPIKYLKESLCDHIAATMVYNGKNYKDDMPLAYFLEKEKGGAMHPETMDKLEEWLTLVAQKGYKQALKEVKRIKSY